MKPNGIYEHTTIDDGIKYTGRPPTSVRWADTNKGTNEEPNAKCRLVARDFRVGKADCFYASMPPLEANTMLFAKTW